MHRTSLHPGRLAPLEKGPEAVLAFLARPQAGGELRGLLALRPHPDQALGLSGCVRTRAEELSHHTVDRSVEVGRDFMDEPDPESSRGIEPLARKEETPRRTFPDLRQHERRDHGRDDPELDLREPEGRILRRDRDVDSRCHAGSAAERVPLDPRDDGSGAVVDRLHHPEQAHRVLDVVVEGKVDCRSLPFDVGAGAEAFAVPSEEHEPGVANVGERLSQIPDELGVERVPTLRLRQGDSQDRSVSLHSQPAHRV